jgi:hypothetical protein
MTRLLDLPDDLLKYTICYLDNRSLKKLKSIRKENIINSYDPDELILKRFVNDNSRQWYSDQFMCQIFDVIIIILEKINDISNFINLFKNEFQQQKYNPFICAIRKKDIINIPKFINLFKNKKLNIDKNVALQGIDTDGIKKPSIYFALKTENYDIIDLLINYLDLNLDYTDIYGRNLIIICMMKFKIRHTHNLKIYRLLLEVMKLKNIDLNKKCIRGFSSLDYSYSIGADHIHKLLKSYNVKSYMY